MPPHKTKRINIATRERMAKAIDLRRQGFLLREIAEKLGMTNANAKSEVSQLIQQGLREITREPAEELLQLELDRLDVIFIPAYTRAMDRTKPLDPVAVEVILKIMTRRAKLLGLDAPTKTAATDPSGKHSADQDQIHFYIPENGRDYPSNDKD